MTPGIPHDPGPALVFTISYSDPPMYLTSKGAENIATHLGLPSLVDDIVVRAGSDGRSVARKAMGHVVAAEVGAFGGLPL